MQPEQKKRIKIEIHLLTPVNRSQSQQFVSELRKIEGVGAVNTKMQPVQKRSGEMNMFAPDMFMDVGYHAALSAALEHHLEKIPGLLSRVFAFKGNTGSGQASPAQAAPGNTPNAELILVVNEHGVRTGYFINSQGIRKKFVSGDFVLNPAKTHAVLIGMGEFPDEPSYASIEPVSNNLGALEEILMDPAFVGLPATNVCKLLNASSASVKRTVRKIANTRELETLIVYYAGHGAYSGDNKYFLAAHDATLRSGHPENHISNAFFEEIQRINPEAQKIIVIDACQSGMAALNNYTPDFSSDRVTGTFLLTSTSHNETSYFNSSDEYTFFTGALIRAFREGGREVSERISLLDLWSATNRHLEDIGKPQPVYVAKINILPEHYQISRNPNFDKALELLIPDQLAAEHKYQEAEREFERLELKYPEEIDLKRRYSVFRQAARGRALTEIANRLFYAEHNYEEALAKYREAKVQGSNPFLEEKIYACKQLLEDGAEDPLPLEEVSSPVVPSAQEKHSSFLSRWIAAFVIGMIFVLSLLFLKGIWHSLFGEEKQKQKNSEGFALPRVNPVIIKAVETLAHKSPVPPGAGAHVSGQTQDLSHAEMLINDVEQFKDSCKTGNLAYASTLIDNVKWTNDPEVWQDLGRIYHTGAGMVPPNPVFSIQWYREVALKYPSKGVMDSLAVVFTEQNKLQSAAAWYQRSADLGDLSAQEKIAYWYEIGKTGRPNRSKAITYYRLAKHQGSKIGEEGLRRLHSSLD